MEEQDQDRRREFKKGIDANATRRRRGEASMEVRKAKKEESLAKRRLMATASASATGSMSQAQALADSTVSSRPTLADIPILAAGLQAPDGDTIANSVQGLRRLLSIESNPPVDEIIRVGAVPLLVQILAYTDLPSIQFEAAWALTNIASTSRTAVVAQHGAVEVLVRLLMSSDPSVREQCAWCLGNIAGDCWELRDDCIKAGALPALILNIKNPENASLLKNVTWTVSNLCRGKPPVNLDDIKPAMEVLAHLVSCTNDQEVLVDATWALSYISDGDNERIQAVVDLNISHVLVRLLTQKSSNVLTPALRTVGNIVTGTDEQTDSVLHAGVLDVTAPLLENAKKNIRKEACWMISNIAAGNHHQMKAVMSTPRLIDAILEQFSRGEWDVQKEALYVVSNIITTKDVGSIQRLCELNVIPYLCNLLLVSDNKIVLLVLETLDNILRVGLQTNSPYTTIVDEADGVSKLEQLQQHENTVIYDKAVEMIEKYFGVEDEVESENLVPNVQNDTFSFGVSSNASKTASCHPAQFQFNFSGNVSL